QNSELPLRALREYTEGQGRQIMEVYQEVISGAKPTRPELNRMMLDAAGRKFDCLLVWKLEGFGRSLVDCLNTRPGKERQPVYRVRTVGTYDPSWFAAHRDAHFGCEFADAFVGELSQASSRLNQAALADNRNILGSGSGI